GTVRAIQEMPVALAMRPKEAADFIRGQQRAFGAQDTLLYSAREVPGLFDVGMDLVRRGVILDYGQSGLTVQELGITAKPGGKATPRGFAVAEEKPPYGGFLERLRSEFGIEQEEQPETQAAQAPPLRSAGETRSEATKTEGLLGPPRKPLRDRYGNPTMYSGSVEGRREIKERTSAIKSMSREDRAELSKADSERAAEVGKVITDAAEKGDVYD